MTCSNCDDGFCLGIPCHVCAPADVPCVARRTPRLLSSVYVWPSMREAIEALDVFSHRDAIAASQVGAQLTSRGYL